VSDLNAEKLRAALKACPKDARPAVFALFKLLNRVGANLGRLSDFARSMDAKNAERNARLNALEARIHRLESARGSEGA
jgi:hypothetical protein